MATLARSRDGHIKRRALYCTWFVNGNEKVCHVSQNSSVFKLLIFAIQGRELSKGVDSFHAKKGFFFTIIYLLSVNQNCMIFFNAQVPDLIVISIL